MITLALKDNNPEVINSQNATNTEQLTAYYEIDCDNQARAIEIAKRTIDSHVTRAEVRYIHT
jgi:hypothetical protein